MMEQPTRAFTPVSKRRPCTVCRHTDWCEVHTASGAVHCMRVENDHPGKRRQKGWWHNLPQPDEKTGQVVWSPEDFAADEPPAAPIADAPTKHAVYTALLTLCPLSPAHRAHLLGPTRQLPEEALATYGTLPEGKAQTPILAALVAEFTREVLLVTPGFTLDQNRPGGLRLNSHGGLLIPVRDGAGRIQGMQVRADRGEPRYRWLSSAEGVSSGTPAHVARPAQVTDQRVYLTEGPLKADIAAGHLGAVVVGITGVTTWRHALPALDALQAEGHDVVVVALDADDPGDPKKQHTVALVEAIRQEVAAALVGMGYAVRFARWDHSAGKGLDDLLLGGGMYVLEAYHPQITPPDGGGGSGGEQGDDYAAGLEPGPLSDGKKLRILSNVLLNKHMKPVDKVTLCDIYLLTGAWPGTEQDGAAGRRKPLLTLAARVNVGRNTVSKSAGFLQAQGLTTVAIRTEMPPPLTFPHPATPGVGGATPERPKPKSVAYFHSGRGLGFDEHLPEAEHRISDRKRRCPSCGSDRLVVHAVVCTRCGTVARVPEAEKAAADYERARYAADLVAGTTTDDHCTESVHASAGENARAQDPHAGTAPQASAESAPVPHACTETVHPSVKGRECSETVHPSESSGACTESVHAPAGDTTPLEWWDDEPEREVAQEWTAEPGATHRPTPAEHGQAAKPDELRRRPHKRAGTTPREPASAAARLIAGLEAAPDVPALEWERRMQTTAQTARYHGLSPEERAQVDGIYQARREALQGQGPPREPGRQSGAWAVA